MPWLKIIFTREQAPDLPGQKRSDRLDLRRNHVPLPPLFRLLARRSKQFCQKLDQSFYKCRRSRGFQS